MDRQQRKDWRQIRGALSKLLTVKPSETFVQQVMGKVEEIPAYQPAGWRLWLDRLTPRIPQWVYPELGVAAAALLLLALTFFQQATPAVSAEALLLSRQTRDIEWVSSPSSSGRRSLAILWEGT